MHWSMKKQLDHSDLWMSVVQGCDHYGVLVSFIEYTSSACNISFNAALFLIDRTLHCKYFNINYTGSVILV